MTFDDLWRMNLKRKPAPQARRDKVKTIDDAKIEAVEQVEVDRYIAWLERNLDDET